MERKVISEKKMVSLVEERGVAASPWKKEIDAIALYIRKTIKLAIQSHIWKSKVEFEIPENLTNSFSFFDGLDISIVGEMTIDNYSSGGGSFGPSNKNGNVKATGIRYDYTTGKLQNAKIIIYCFYDKNGKVWLNTILTSLYHELNHAYDAWVDKNRSGSFRRYNRTAKKSLYGDSIKDMFPIIGECIYRLFSETEYNALVASVYGDLQGRDSELSTFQTDYKKTQAYQEYLLIKNRLADELNSLDKVWAANILNGMRTNGITLNMKANTLKSFKIAFADKADRLLNELLHDIGRVASFYYDQKQEEREGDNNTVTDTIK